MRLALHSLNVGDPQPAFPLNSISSEELARVARYINEIDNYGRSGKTWAAYRYGLGSEGIAQLLLLAINGVHRLSADHI